MNIIQGRGNRRRVIELPNGTVFKTAEKAEPGEYHKALDAVRDMLLGSDNLIRVTNDRFKRMTIRTLAFTPRVAHPGRRASI
jgi:hypothetical protein